MTRFFLLAAGLGVRARPLSDQLAKPAFPLAGRSFAARLLDPLPTCGIDRGFINLCHLPETVRESLPRPGPLVHWIGETEPTGSLVLRKALDEPWEHLLALNGDTWQEPSWLEMEQALVRSKAAAALRVRSDPRGDYSALATDRDGVLRRLPPQAGATMYTGAALLTRRAVEAIESRNFITDLASRRLPVLLFPYQGPWLDGGSPGLYLRANLDFIANAGLPESTLISPAARVERGARVTRSVVWPGALVPAGAILDECLVMGKARPEPGFHRRMLFVPGGSWPIPAAEG